MGEVSGLRGYLRTPASHLATTTQGKKKVERRKMTEEDFRVFWRKTIL
jgi:hypothetical protein